MDPIDAKLYDLRGAYLTGKRDIDYNEALVELLTLDKVKQYLKAHIDYKAPLVEYVYYGHDGRIPLRGHGIYDILYQLLSIVPEEIVRVNYAANNLLPIKQRRSEDEAPELTMANIISEFIRDITNPRQRVWDTYMVAEPWDVEMRQYIDSLTPLPMDLNKLTGKYL